MYSSKPTDLAGFTVMTPQEKDISFEMRRQNMLEQEAANRADLENQHKLELEAERIKNERLISKLKADNDAKIKKLHHESEQDKLANRQQGQAFAAAMVEAERRRAEIDKMSLERPSFLPWTTDDAKAMLAALRRENALLLRENVDLHYSPRISPAQSPSMGAFDYPGPAPGPYPMLAGCETPLFLSRDSFATPSQGSISRAHNVLALPAIEGPPSHYSTHHARSVSASVVTTPRIRTTSEIGLSHRAYLERPPSRASPGHSRSASADHVFPRSPVLRDTPSFSQDHTGHLMPGNAVSRARHVSLHTPSSPLHYVPSRPSSRHGSPSVGYFDLPRLDQSAAHSPGGTGIRFTDQVPSPALGQRAASSFASRDHSPNYSPPRDGLHLELSIPPTGSEYRRQRRSSHGGLQMLPAPPSHGAYEQSGWSGHAKALADALTSEQQGLRVRHRRNSHTSFGPPSIFNTQYHTPIGSQTPLY